MDALATDQAHTERVQGSNLAAAHVSPAPDPVSGSSRAAGIKEQARRKIAEAEAAIAAAEASAMRNMKHERFSAHRIPPWVMPTATQDPRLARPQASLAGAPSVATRHGAGPALRLVGAPAQHADNVAGSSSQHALPHLREHGARPAALRLAQGMPMLGATQHTAQADGGKDRPRLAAQHPSWARQPGLPSFPSVTSGAGLPFRTCHSR